jgi:hypothetical protein
MEKNFKRNLFYKLVNKKPIKFFLKIFPSRESAARLEHRRIGGKNSRHGK